MEHVFEHFAAGERLYTMMVTPVCEKHGLTYMEFTVLMFLSNNPRFDTAAQIVRYRRLTKSHVSLSVRSLQQRGLLRGEYRGTDRKSIHLRLCPEAMPIVEDGRKAQADFGEVLLAGFSPQEQQRLMDDMLRIDRNVSCYIAEKRKKENCDE